MLASIGKWILMVILEFLAKLGFRAIKNAENKASDEKKNKEIDDAISKAKSEQEAQDALNQAASRLGRQP